MQKIGQRWLIWLILIALLVTVNSSTLAVEAIAIPISSAAEPGWNQSYSTAFPELALSPDLWMHTTHDWPSEVLPGISEGNPAIILRYPLSWNKIVLTNGLQLTTTGYQILVTTEDIRASETSTLVEPHEDIVKYQREGYKVTNVTVKGLPAWQILPSIGSRDFCQKVIIALPYAWVRLQMGAPSAPEEHCSIPYEFDMLLSSIQVAIGTQVENETRFTELLDGTEYQTQQITYDRQAAYDYALQYWSSCNNSDGYCAPAGEGLHFIAHALCAGGFPTHWCANPQQGHSDSRVASASAQRSYVKAFPGVESITASSMGIGDVVYIGKDDCWGFGGIVTAVSEGIPYITTHSAYHWNMSYDLFYSICGTPATYDFVHISTGITVPAQIYLPLVLQQYTGYFVGSWEVEPNNTYQQANGPLHSGRDYYGYPNDTRDYFSVNLRQVGQIGVDLTSHTGQGVQLQLWYGPPQLDGSNRVELRTEAPYQFTHTGSPGWYYIMIYTESGHNQSTPYTLRVTYSE